MKSWGEDLWEAKVNAHGDAGVIFGTGHRLSSVHRQTRTEMERVDRLLLKRIPAGSSILDAGVGPMARFSIELARRGYLPIGLDISTTTLQRAKAATARAGIAVDFVHGDLVALDLGRTVDGIFCMETIFHVPAHLALEVFQGFHRHLRAGGFALIKFAILERQTVYFSLCQALYLAAFAILRPVLRFVGRESFRTTVVRYSTDELMDIFERTGFELVERDGDMFLLAARRKVVSTK